MGNLNRPERSRRVLLSAGAAAAGLQVVRAVRAAAPPPAPRKGYAIVGLGQIATQMLAGMPVAERSRITALVSGNKDKAKAWAAQYGVPAKNLYDYKSFDSIKNNPEIDGVYIALPNSMHAEYTIRAAKAGKHVLCEKPMATTPADCQAMIDACKAAKRKLMIAYRLHYEPFTQALIKAVRDQEIGTLRMVTAEAGFSIGDPTQWRLKRAMAGGGSLMDIGVYALQAARYITGEEPIELNAFMHSTPNDPRFAEVEENIAFQLRFPSGVLANCTSSYGVGMNRFRATGTKGWAELEPGLSYEGLRMRVGTRNKVEERSHPRRNHFALEIDHLSDCLMKEQEPKTGGAEGLRDLRIMMAIYESANAGKVVKLG